MSSDGSECFQHHGGRFESGDANKKNANSNDVSRLFANRRVMAPKAKAKAGSRLSTARPRGSVGTMAKSKAKA